MHRHAAQVKRISMMAVVVLLCAAALSLATAPAALATHYRANQLTWHSEGGGVVEFDIGGSWRCSFYASPCAFAGPFTFEAGTLDFGDGSAQVLVYLSVVSTDPANDVLTAEAHVRHTYVGAGPFTAVVFDCCRLGAAGGHVNNADGKVSYQSVVDVSADVASPISQMSPIVDCPLNSLCSFTVPALDPNGQPLAWRLSTPSEAGSGAFNQPAGASIEAATGRYTWDTTGATLTSSGPSFYSTQVMIENVVDGVVVSSTPVDFFIRLGSGASNGQPVFAAPTPADGATLTATVGTPFTFDVAATDPDSGDTVSLGLLGKPADATYATAPGNPGTGTFTWTPTATGDVILTLTAADHGGRGAIPRSFTIRVAAPVQPPPVVDAGPDQVVAEGSAVGLAGSVTDSGATTTGWSASPGPGVDTGATCTFADPASTVTTVTCTDDGPWMLTLSASDGVNAPVTDTMLLTVTNVAPTVLITAPADASMVTLGSVVTLTASVADVGANDTLSCAIDWGDGTSTAGTLTGGVCAGSHGYAAEGRFAVTVTARDDDAADASASLTIVAAAAPAKVTGGGCLGHPGASFGFVAQTSGAGFEGQLQVRARGKDRFHGTTVTSLVVLGHTATWSGGGFWNHQPGYTFTATIVDNRNGGSPKGPPDSIRLTIKAPNGTVVFTAGGPLAGGNVTIH